MIPNGDDISWLVYADWLEERGKDGEAQDLRESIAENKINIWSYEYRSYLIGVGGGVGVSGVGGVGGVGGAGIDSVGIGVDVGGGVGGGIGVGGGGSIGGGVGGGLGGVGVSGSVGGGVGGGG